MEVKTCTKCHKTYPLTDEYFYFVKSRNRFRSWCRECEKEYGEAYYEANKGRYKTYYEANKESRKERGKVYREANKERVKEKNKAYYEANKEHIKEYNKAYRENNKVRLKERNKAYRENNKEHLKEYKMTYYEANKERVKEKNKAYYEANKEIYRKHYQIRRARIRSLDANFTDGDWLFAVEEFDNKCAYCGKELKLEQDHFVPLSKGGGYTKDNIVPACKHCNCSKCDSAFGEWYHSQPFYSAKREKHILQYLGKAVAV